MSAIFPPEITAKFRASDAAPVGWIPQMLRQEGLVHFLDLDKAQEIPQATLETGNVQLHVNFSWQSV